MIRNRYNYPTPPIRDIKGKETQTRNNWTLMETALAESQTDSHFPTMWPNGYPKQKNVSDTHIQRRTITKINHDRRTALERSVKNISLVQFDCVHFTDCHRNSFYHIVDNYTSRLAFFINLPSMARYR